MPTFEKIIYERDGFIARVTINRPERMNAMDRQTWEELRAAFEDFRYNDDLRVAIVSGAGERAFSAGADLVARSKGEKRQPIVHITQAGLIKGPPIYKPIIAAINGYCLAGGLEVALACDIRIATPSATFGLFEVRWGIIPGGGGTQRLPRAIPQALANEMILTAEPIDAERALQAGLISRIVPTDGLQAEATRIAEVISTRGPLAVRAAKELIQRGADMPLQDALRLEDYFSLQLYTTEDAVEGPRAFAEKRPPNFKGR
ncbi:MAG: enoyl-CoA hydratase-related protein [Chloroflexota bacterium]|nr:enoyl-CoA hydratase-related protein [Chloroflexota bacterium]